MNIQTKIKMAVAFKGISQAQLARDIEMTPQNFNNKLKRGTFTEDEMATIARSLRATFNQYFEFEDGTKI